MHPESFLRTLFRQEPARVLMKLKAQAADRNRTLTQLLEILRATVPGFATLVSASIASD